MKIGLTRISLKCAIVLVACRVYCCLGKSRNEEAFVTYHGISNGRNHIQSKKNNN